ncbi:MAG: hypothetical protein AAB645_01815 [Patescibacteria group bacterium]
MENNRGFIKLILLIIVVILVLSYFGISLRKIVESNTSKDNFSFVWDMAGKGWIWLVNVWNNYLATSARWFWNEMILKYVWSPLSSYLDKFIRK